MCKDQEFMDMKEAKTHKVTMLQESREPQEIHNEQHTRPHLPVSQKGREPYTQSHRENKIPGSTFKSFINRNKKRNTKEMERGKD